MLLLEVKCSTTDFQSVIPQPNFNKNNKTQKRKAKTFCIFYSNVISDCPIKSAPSFVKHLPNINFHLLFVGVILASAPYKKAKTIDF